VDRKAALRFAKQDLRARVVGEREDRALLAVEEQKKGAPLRKALAKKGAPAAGDRRGPAASRLMMHRERLVVPRGVVSDEALELVAETPAIFDRWLHRRETELPKDDEDLRARLGEAVARRWALAAPYDEEAAGARGATDVYRLVHGAGDALPGVELDRYGDWAVLALRSEEAVARRDRLLDAVADLGVAGVYLKLRPKQANVVVDTRTEDLAPAEAQRGRDAPSPLVVHEGPLPFEARLGDGLSTGLFLDQRDMRRWLYRAAKGKAVLNLFCYHAAFTVAAVLGGAERSVSVDVSAAALDRARENLERLGADAETHQLVKADAMKWLERSDEPFDLVILDPPSFATTKRSTFRAARDYPKLAARALRRVAPGGQLLACTNHRGMVRAKFRRQIDEAAKEAGVRVARRREVPPPVDFPPAPGRDPHLKRILVELAP
jgi:23S rRNA (cytosine1962-C5)-methyltransferase